MSTDYGAKLKELFEKEKTTLAEFAAAANAVGATLGTNQTYNAAFDKARKEFEAETAKIQAAVEEELKNSDAEIADLVSAANIRISVSAAVKTETQALIGKTLAAQQETLELEKGRAAAEDAEGKAPREDLASAGDADIAFYTKVGQTSTTIRSLLFTLSNKASTISQDDFNAVEASVQTLSKTEGIFGCQEAIKELTSLYQALADQLNARGDLISSNELNTSALGEFLNESAKLLQWCRQMKTDLEALTEPDHIQKFCSALEANYVAMDENFDTLSEMGASLLPNAVVKKTLIECNEVWLNLQIFAHEVLQHTLLEIHVRSKLEDEVRAFSSYSTKLNQLLTEVKTMLNLPQDDESKAVVQAVVAQTDQLQRDLAPHALLPDHLRDFSLRMECIRDNYTNLRRTVFGRMTFLSQQQPALLNASHRRREEYLSRMKDLKGWVEKKAQGESCQDIYNRVLKIKALIDREYEHVRNIQA